MKYGALIAYSLMGLILVFEALLGGIISTKFNFLTIYITAERGVSLPTLILVLGLLVGSTWSVAPLMTDKWKLSSVIRVLLVPMAAALFYGVYVGMNLNEPLF